MQKFNANFYVVAATIIPVLYLALTLQGKVYGDFVAQLKAATEDTSKFRELLKSATGIRNLLRELQFMFYGVYAAVGLYFIVSGIVGEFAALNALYDGQADRDTGRICSDFGNWSACCLWSRPTQWIYWWNDGFCYTNVSRNNNRNKRNEGSQFLRKTAAF